LRLIIVGAAARVPRLHGAEQSISIDDALRAYTIHAAYHLRREHDLGSIEVGKLADFVQLSADPYLVDPAGLDDEVKVLGTWSGGVRVDVDAFMADIAKVDPATHAGLVQAAAQHTCCKAAASVDLVAHTACSNASEWSWNQPAPRGDA